MKEREQLLRNIQIHGFSMLESAMFLDTHPEDADAMARYSSCRDETKQLINTYEMKYGPLTTAGNYCTDSWQWIDCPWPWERQA